MEENFKFTIQFYEINDETPIASIYDAVSNPFSKGDIIHLSVDDIVPKKLNEYSPEAQKVSLKNNQRLKKLFHLVKIQLIKEGKHLELESGKLIIKYHCKML